MEKMQEIEELALNHAGALADLERAVQRANNAKRRALLPHLQAIKGAAEAVKETERVLVNEIGANRRLFEKPKTRNFHGLRVGLKKAKGEIKFADAETVIKKIRQFLADRFEDLVKTDEKPIKDALSHLTAAELKKLGVTVENASDLVYIGEPKSDARKLAEALLEQAA